MEQASLLVYDSERKLWHREDELRAEGFVCKGGELYCLSAEGKLLSMHGESGEKETGFSLAGGDRRAGAADPGAQEADDTAAAGNAARAGDNGDGVGQL